MIVRAIVCVYKYIIRRKDSFFFPRLDAADATTRRHNLFVHPEVCVHAHERAGPKRVLDACYAAGITSRGLLVASKNKPHARLEGRSLRVSRSRVRALTESKPGRACARACLATSTRSVETVFYSRQPGTEREWYPFASERKRALAI